MCVDISLIYKRKYYNYSKLKSTKCLDRVQGKQVFFCNQIEQTFEDCCLVFVHSIAEETMQLLTYYLFFFLNNSMKRCPMIKAELLPLFHEFITVHLVQLPMFFRCLNCLTWNIVILLRVFTTSLRFLTVLIVRSSKYGFYFSRLNGISTLDGLCNVENSFYFYFILWNPKYETLWVSMNSVRFDHC